MDAKASNLLRGVTTTSNLWYNGQSFVLSDLLAPADLAQFSNLSLATLASNSLLTAGNAGTEAVLLSPMVVTIVNRDDPRATWANAQPPGAGPVYAGDITGDMVSWQVPNPGDWSSATFTWSATGPGNQTIAGPSGIGVNEWRIADTGGNDPGGNTTLHWSPGLYSIHCQMDLPAGGSIPISLPQNVGVRTDDIVVVGWINPGAVTLNTSGVQNILKTILPVGGLKLEDTDDAKLDAALLLNWIAGGDVSTSFGTIQPTHIIIYQPFSSADKSYALNWMFKFAGNPQPPTSFTSSGNFSQSSLDNFANNNTTYKLINHYQAKFLVGPDRKFKPKSLIYRRHRVYIGNTIDPSRLYDLHGIFDSLILYFAEYISEYPDGGIFPGQAELPNNSIAPVNSSTQTMLINEGRPDANALNAFRTLTGYDQGHIWSTITFFSDPAFYSPTLSLITSHLLTRSPFALHPSSGRINTQVYPTYWIYINGVHVGTQNQAPDPSALFPNPDTGQ